MKTRIALVAALALTAGSAFAQLNNFPAATGEGPLFQREAQTTSQLPRAAVRPQAAVQFPATGEFDGAAAVAQRPAGEHPTRADAAATPWRPPSLPSRVVARRSPHGDAECAEAR